MSSSSAFLCGGCLARIVIKKSPVSHEHGPALMFWVKIQGRCNLYTVKPASSVPLKSLPEFIFTTIRSQFGVDFVAMKFKVVSSDVNNLSFEIDWCSPVESSSTGRTRTQKGILISLLQICP